MASRWLSPDGDANLVPFARFWVEVVFPFWRERGARAVREGDPGETLYDWLGDDEAAWATAQAGFRAAASLLIEPVGDALGDVSDARVLDVGSGHGAYAVELARRGASVTLADRGPALEPARTAADDAGVRMTFVEGDYRADELWQRLGERAGIGNEVPDAGFDLVLLFNVLHGHRPDEAAALLDYAAAALAPGGRIAILDQFERDGGSTVADAGVALLDLTYRITLGGGTLDPDAVNRRLGDAGVTTLETISFRRAPGVKLLLVESPYRGRDSGRGP